MVKLRRQGGLMINNSDISFVDKIEELRAIPPLVIDLMTLLNDTSIPIHVIEEKIKLDPAITSYLLKQCNSPLFGFRTPIDTVSHGLKMFGYSRCKSMLISYFLRNLYNRPGKKYITYYLWEHSVYVAFTARELAINLNQKKITEEVYIGGLLHDIGKLAIYYHDPETYEYLVLEADRERKSLLPLEQDVYGYSHVETGYRLLDKWKFPDIYKDSILYHHDIKNYQGNDKVVPLVAFANSTVQYAIEKRGELPGEYLELYKLSEIKYYKILDKIFHILVQSWLF
jgi:putative nucleotidyltransferase with HDIG domain